MSSEGTEIQFSVPIKEKCFESLQEKILKNVTEKEKHSEVGKQQCFLFPVLKSVK